MKKRVWGIILVTFGVMAILGMLTNPNQPGSLAPALLVTILMIAGGIVLVVFAQKEFTRREAILNAAFAQLRQQNFVDASAIGSSVGLFEMEVRRIVVEEQIRGLLPPNVAWTKMHAVSGEGA